MSGGVRVLKDHDGQVWKKTGVGKDDEQMGDKRNQEQREGN